MSAFSQKYSPEQRQAVVNAVLDGVDGEPGSGPLGRGEARLGQPMTANEAVRAAAEGRLPELEPFEINLYTVRNYAGDERRERVGKVASRLDRKQPLDAATELWNRATRIAEKAMRAIESGAKNPRPTAKEAQDAIAMAEKYEQAARKRMQPFAPGPASPGARDSGDAGTDQSGTRNGEPNDFAAQLAAQSRDTKAPSDQTPEDRQGTERRDGAELSSDRKARTEDEESEDRFPVLAEFSSPDPSRLAAAQALLSSGA